MPCVVDHILLFWANMVFNAMAYLVGLHCNCCFQVFFVGWCLVLLSDSERLQRCWRLVLQGIRIQVYI